MELVPFETLHDAMAGTRDAAQSAERAARRQDDKARFHALYDLFCDLVTDFGRGQISLSAVDRIVPTLAYALHLQKATRMGGHGEEEVYITQSEEESNNLRLANWYTEQLKGFKEQTPELPT